MVRNAWCVIVLLTLSTLLLAGCGRPELQSLAFNPAPWQAGEISEYAITDVNGNYAGTARYVVQLADEQNNPDGWILQREITAQGASERVTVAMNPSFRPITSVLVRTVGAREERVAATYNNSQVEMELTTAQNVTTYQRVNVTSDVRDGNVLLPVVRALPLSAGYATRLNSFLPVVGRQETFTIEVVGDETVVVPAGSFTTWKVELTTNDQQTTAWFSQEAPFVLVQYVDGRNGGTLELTSFERGG